MNILINSGEDKDRGVSFYPPNWSEADVLNPLNIDDEILPKRIRTCSSVHGHSKIRNSGLYFLCIAFGACRSNPNSQRAGTGQTEKRASDVNC